MLLTDKTGKISGKLATPVVLFDGRCMAKEQTQEQTSDTDILDVPEALGPPKSYRMHILIGIAGILLFQVIVLLMLLPRKPAPEYRGGISPVNGPNIFGTGSAPPVILTKEKMAERPIKEGSITVKNNRDGANESVSLVMHVKVREKEATKFDNLYGKCQNTILDRISGILAAATRDELSEPTFTAIKEKSKQAINEILEFPYVQEVLVADQNYQTSD